MRRPQRSSVTSIACSMPSPSPTPQGRERRWQGEVGLPAGWLRRSHSLTSEGWHANTHANTHPNTHVRTHRSTRTHEHTCAVLGASLCAKGLLPMREPEEEEEEEEGLRRAVSVIIFRGNDRSDFRELAAKMSDVSSDPVAFLSHSHKRSLSLSFKEVAHSFSFSLFPSPHLLSSPPASPSPVYARGNIPT